MWRIGRGQIIIKGTPEHLSGWEEMFFPFWSYFSFKQLRFALHSSLVLLCYLLALRVKEFGREITSWRDPVININCRKQVWQMSWKALCSVAYLRWHMVLALQAQAVDCMCFFPSFVLWEGRRMSVCSTVPQRRSWNNSPWEGSEKFTGLQNSISFF